VTTLVLTQDIPLPVAAVWEELRHIDRHVGWMNDAVSLTFVTDQTEGVGTSFRCLTKVGPFVTTDVMTITVWEPERAMGVAHQGLITGEGLFTLAPSEGGARMTWKETLHFPWWAGGPLGAAVASPVLRLIWRTNLRNLRAQCLTAQN